MIKEIQEKYDMWADDFNLDPKDVELLIKTSKRAHELESESYNAHLERLLDKKEFQNKHYREAILLAYYELGFALNETEIDKTKERILQAKLILRNANVLGEIK